MFAPKYVGISQGSPKDNPGYVLFSGVKNVRPQISLGFPKDMLGIFHFKITHKHVTFDLKMQRQTEAADQQSSLQMAHNERIIQGLLNVRTLLECISAIQDSKATRPT